ncbi:hypothetical protein ACN7OV_07640 [Aerococcus urinaeequi]|uniref:hypothetical protein n=1 Tax=Aerococcus urinaeequi TaxID=51665 RepID=UPI003B3AE221
MNKDGILFLRLDSEDFYSTNIKKQGVRVESTFKSMNRLGKIIRRFQIKFSLDITRWLGDWMYELDTVDTIILQDSILIPPVIDYINSINNNIRIILWYWNPVGKTVSLNEVDRNKCEVWSFDEDDCIKYQLNYNTQYYFNDITISKKNTESKIDALFLGKDKGRLEKLLKLEKQLNTTGLKTYFHITPDNRKKIRYINEYKKSIAYEKYLKYIENSKAIIDYVSADQRGLTLRPLESLFLDKKLITNDFNIKNRDFYRKENIFILNEDEDILSFINEPTVPVNKEIKEKYEFNTWLKRFF